MILDDLPGREDREDEREDWGTPTFRILTEEESPAKETEGGSREVGGKSEKGKSLSKASSWKKQYLQHLLHDGRCSPQCVLETLVPLLDAGCVPYGNVTDKTPMSQ